MTPKQLFISHRSWEDLAIAILGVAVMALTWSHARELVPGTPVPGALINSAVIGVLLLILGFYEIAERSRGIEYAVFICGIWLFASPFIFGFNQVAGMALWHFALGVVVLALTALEIWQDWDLSGEQMHHHRH